MGVILLGCEAGVLDKGGHNAYNQTLANLLNAVVKAPDDLVWFPKNGQPFVAPVDPITKSFDPNKPEIFYETYPQM